MQSSQSDTGLGETLDTARQSLGLTWSEVAARADITPNGLGRIRLGEVKPRIITLRALERALELPAGSLSRPAADLATVGQLVVEGGRGRSVTVHTEARQRTAAQIRSSSAVPLSRVDFAVETLVTALRGDAAALSDEAAAGIAAQARDFVRFLIAQDRAAGAGDRGDA